MASFQKYSINEIGRMFQHNNRTPNDGIERSNEEINPEMTKFNYHLKKGTPKDISKRIDEVFLIKKDGSVVMGEMVVTLPKDVKEEDERKFFQSVYDFYVEDFGEENVVNAVVHKDETTPHLHLDFIPIIRENAELKGKQGVALNKWKKQHELDDEEEFERVCCKELINRDYLRQMHIRLSEYVADSLGYEVEILNGATVNGNKTVQELKIQKLEKKREELEKKVESLNEDLKVVHNKIKECGLKPSDFELMPLLRKIDYLEKTANTFRKIVLRNKCKYSMSEFEPIKVFEPSASSNVNIYDGSITKMPIEKNAIVIIELPNKEERVYPQQELIDRSSDVSIQLNFAKRIKENVVLRKSRMSERKYIFLKTDNERETVDCLLEMGSVLKKELKNQKRKVYMDRIATDKFDIAKSILANLNTDVIYCTTLQVEEQIQEQDKENEKSEKNDNN